MKVCPKCHYTSEEIVCPSCGNDMLPYVDEGYEFLEIKEEKERRFLRRWGGLLIRVSVICAVILILYFYSGGDLKALFFPQTGRVIPAEADFTVTKQVTFTSEGRSNLTYDLFIPKNNSYQTVREIRLNPRPIVDPYDETHVYWEITLNDGQTLKIAITYTIHTEGKRQKMDASESGTLRDIPVEYIQRYIPANVTEETPSGMVVGHNGQEWYRENGDWTIDPELPEIQEIAKNLSSGRIKVYDMVRAVYDWVRSRYRYERGESLKTCKEMLYMTAGDCDDQSVVFISILRAMGIPAWLELGVLYNERGAAGGTWFGHGWANVVIPKKDGGVLIGQIDLVNDLFLVRGANRFTEFVDDGNGDHLEDYYVVLRYRGVVRSSYTYITRSWDSRGEIWLERKYVSDIGPIVISTALLCGLLLSRHRRKRLVRYQAELTVTSTSENPPL